MLPSFGYAVFVFVVNLLHRKVARFCTDMENHRYQTNWMNSFTFKRITFEMWTHFAPSLLIIHPCDTKIIRTAYIRFFIAVTLRRALTDIFHPYIKFKLFSTPHSCRNERRDDKAIASRLLENVDQCEHDECDAYVDAVIMISSTLLFAPLHPLGAAVTVIYLFIKARADLFKLLYFFRRTVPQRRKTIAPWTNIISVVVLASVFLNCFLIGCWTGELQSWLPKIYRKVSPDIVGDRTRFQQKLGNYSVFGGRWCSAKRCTTTKPLHSKYITGLMMVAEHLLLLIGRFLDVVISI